jgi:chitodextrinase
VTISWLASRDNVLVTGYGLYRGSSRIDTTTETNGTFGGLACGTAYQVGVDAVDAAGNRSQRVDLTVTTSACLDTQAPSKPGNVTATTRTATSIALLWAPSVDNIGVIGYRLYRGGAETGTTAGLTGIFNGLTCGTNYTLAVEAYDAAGNRSQQAVVLVATTACPDTQAPSAPTGLAVSNVTQTSMTFTWLASTDNVGVTGYDVYRGSAKTGSTTSLTSPQSALSCGTSYTFGVVAYDAAGNRSPQAQLTRSTLACSPPPSGGTVAVSAAGNDATCVRGDLTKPCSSFQRALNVAQAGDSITVAGGTYPGQQLTGNKSVTFRVASGATATFSGRLTLYNLTGVTLVGPFRGNGHSDFDIWFDGCDADITVDGWTGLAFGMVGSANDVTLRNLDMGGYSASNDPPGDSGISPNPNRCNGGGTIADDRMVRNVLVENSRFHDVFYGMDDSQWAGAHPDCFEVEGRVDGVTLRNVTFERCGNTWLALYPDFGDILNVTVEASTFRQIGHETYYAIQFASGGKPGKCGNVRFVNNSYDATNPSALSPNPAPRFDCATVPGYQPVLVQGNTFYTAIPASVCSISRGAPWNTVWQGNTFLAGGSCP